MKAFLKISFILFVSIISSCSLQQKAYFSNHKVGINHSISLSKQHLSKAKKTNTVEFVSAQSHPDFTMDFKEEKGLITVPKDIEIKEEISLFGQNQLKTDHQIFSKPNVSKIKAVSPELKDSIPTQQNQKPKEEEIKYNRFAIAGFVISILNILPLIFNPTILLFTIPISLIICIIGLVQIKKNNKKYKGRKMALVGFILNTVAYVEMFILITTQFVLTALISDLIVVIASIFLIFLLIMLIVTLINDKYIKLFGTL